MAQNIVNSRLSSWFHFGSPNAKHWVAEKLDSAFVSTVRRFMHVRPLHHVSVWLDDRSTDTGAFPEALDWATRLSLPLRALVTSRRYGRWDSDQENCQPNESEPTERVPTRIGACGALCARRGVTMETSFWLGEPHVGIEQFLRPWGLCVLEEDRGDPVRERL